MIYSVDEVAPLRQLLGGITPQVLPRLLAVADFNSLHSALSNLPVNTDVAKLNDGGLLRQVIGAAPDLELLVNIFRDNPEMLPELPRPSRELVAKLMRDYAAR